MKYSKTYLMNIVATVFWLALFVSLVINKLYGDIADNAVVLVSLMAFHLFLIITFSVSAYSIKGNDKKRLALVSEALNYTLICMIFIQFVLFLKFFLNPAYAFSADRILFFGFCAGVSLFLFVLPAVVNLKAVKRAQ